MSNMQTELQRVFAEWEQGDAKAEPNLTAKGQKGFKPTNNVSRATFNYVRDNPGCTRAQATDALSAMGYKLSSTASLLSALTRQRQLRILEDGTMHANLTEYAPLKMSSSKKSKKAKKAKGAQVDPTTLPVVHVDIADIERRVLNMAIERGEQKTPAPAEKRAQLIMHRTADDMDKYIDTLNVRQAKVLMQKLKAIFGEGV
jgi:hypothetical protein